MKKLSTIIFFIILSAAGLTADDTMTGAFDGQFKTLRISQNDNPIGFPMMVLGSDDFIEFSFDELAEDRSYLRYRVIHCNADWKPSDLVESEYLDGFNFGDVENYSFSRATTVHYVHYSITLPNNQINITHSGNYLLQVYREDNPDEILVQFRFYVSEQNVMLSGGITTVTDVDYNAAHQQLSLEIDCSHAPVESLFSDLKVIILQNNRTDNQIMLTHPMRVKGRTAVYEHQPQLIFEGGNEYRRFETVSTSFPSIGVNDITYTYPYYHFNLFPDGTRAYSQYLYDQTINGRFFIRESNSVNSDTEADYAVVHFSLDAPYIPNRDIFIEGDITNRRLDSSSMMNYNSETGKYEKIMLLKQGQYNYLYLSRKNNSDKLETAPLEGNFYQTVNQYSILTYTRPRGERADRLIGYSVIRSF